MVDSQVSWKKCSLCKKSISFRERYWVCSVSTCNGKRTGLTFCSYECWDSHVPGARHKDAWAEERAAPSRAEWEGRERNIEVGEGDGARRRVVASRAPERAVAPEPPREILVVVSRLKEYIRGKSGMNTSDGVLDLLSDRLRVLCDSAIERAHEAGRKTVMDRDFE